MHPASDTCDEVITEPNRELEALAEATALCERQRQQQERLQRDLEQQRAAMLERRKHQRDLFVKVYRQAEQARAQDYTEASLPRLAQSMVVLVEDLRDGDGLITLDDLPASVEAAEELLPLRFAIQLLKVARRGVAAVLNLLGQLKQRPLWQEFYEWLFPLADRLCGCAFLFEQIEHQSTYPLPSRCGHEVWHAANRLLGRAKSEPTPLPPVEPPPPQTVANNAPISELADATKSPSSASSQRKDAAPLEAAGKPIRKSNRGRKPDTDAAQDRQIATAWQTGCYLDYTDLGRELDLKAKDIRKAVDRHRKRRGLAPE